MMVYFSSLLVVAFAAVGSIAAPSTGTSNALKKRQSTPNSEGWHDDFYYSWWSDGGAQATYTNLAGGSYEIQWGTGGNLVGGKGWNPGVNARYMTSKRFFCLTPCLANSGITRIKHATNSNYVGLFNTLAVISLTATVISPSMAGPATPSWSTTSLRISELTILQPMPAIWALLPAMAALIDSARARAMINRVSTAPRPLTSTGLSATANAPAAPCRPAATSMPGAAPD